jgi:threonine dehydratase
MDLAQIQAELDELGRQKDAIRDRMRDLIAQRDAIAAEQAAASALAAMPAGQRDAIVKLAVLEASGEAMTPGG